MKSGKENCRSTAGGGREQGRLALKRRSNRCHSERSEAISPEATVKVEKHYLNLLMLPDYLMKVHKFRLKAKVS